MRCTSAAAVHLLTAESPCGVRQTPSFCVTMVNSCEVAQGEQSNLDPMTAAQLWQQVEQVYAWPRAEFRLSSG